MSTEIKRELIDSVNFSKRDMINSRNGIALQDLDNNQKITVKGAALMSVPDEDTGEIKTVSAIIASDGVCYTSISSVIADTIPDVIDLITDEGECTIQLSKRTSKGGRTFLSLIVL